MSSTICSPACFLVGCFILSLCGVCPHADWTAQCIGRKQIHCWCRAEGSGPHASGDLRPLSPFDSSAAAYSLDFTQHWGLVPVPFRARQAVSLCPACATPPCNQRWVHQRIVAIFPRSGGENAITRRAQYGCTGRGGEWLKRLA